MEQGGMRSHILSRTYDFCSENRTRRRPSTTKELLPEWQDIAICVATALDQIKPQENQLHKLWSSRHEHRCAVLDHWEAYA